MLEHLYRALRSTSGTVIRCAPGQFETCRQRLYAERKAVMDPALDVISIVQSPTDPDELWLVKKASPDVPS